MKKLQFTVFSAKYTCPKCGSTNTADTGDGQFYFCWDCHSQFII